VRAAGARNILMAWVLVAILAAAFAGLGWLVAGLRGATLFAFCSVLAASGVYAFGDRILLGMLGARPLVAAEHPLLRSTVDRLSAQLQVRAPKLALASDGFPRAFVVGRGPHGSTLALSSGLLTALSPAELEAVLAHELAHVRRRDVLTQTFVVVLATTLLELTRVGGWLSRALLAVLAPVAAAFTHLMLSPKRELAADTAAAALTDPHDLADALLRLDRAGDLVSFEASIATEPLYTVSPFDATERIARMFVTHPPVEERVQRLRSLGGAAPPTSGEHDAPDHG
jgi:heat shock protein HtpX